MIDSGSSQLSILEASGWSRRSFSVRLVHSVKVTLKSASNVEGAEIVLEVDDMKIMGEM